MKRQKKNFISHFSLIQNKIWGFIFFQFFSFFNFFFGIVVEDNLEGIALHLAFPLVD